MRPLRQFCRSSSARCLESILAYFTVLQSLVGVSSVGRGRGRRCEGDQKGEARGFMT